MQQITILCPTPLQKDKAINDLINDYTKRLTAKIDIKNLNVKSHTNDSGDRVKKSQGESLLLYIDKLTHNTAVIALDERGAMPDSPELSKKISSLQLNGQSNLCVIIGGAYGLSEDVLKRADYKLSLGKMVWPHRLVSVMILEQLYRAQQINAGHPYHKV